MATTRSATMRRMERLLAGLIAGLAAWLFGLAICLAADRVLDRAVLLDPSGTLGIADVEGGSFEPIGPIWNGGYTPSAVWVRLRMAPVAPGETLRLRVRPAFLDSVDLYIPDSTAPGGWRVERSGDSVAIEDRALPAQSPEFEIAPAAGEVYFLRIRSTSSVIVATDVMDPLGARNADLRSDFAIIGFIALMGAMLVGAINELVVGRERLLVWFIVHQSVYLLYAVAIGGWLPLLVPALDGHLADRATSTLVCLVALSGLWFHRVLMGQFRPHRLALAFWDALLVLDALALLLYWVGPQQMALWLNSSVLLLAAPGFILLALTARQDALPGLTVLRVAYLVQALSLLALVSPLLGFIGGVEWALSRALVHGLLSGSLMYALLFLRSRQRARGMREASLQLTLARRQIEIEQRQRDMQGRFLAMLAHELKTSITIARFASDSMRDEAEQQRAINAALDNMNAIIDRCAYADQMEQGELGVEREPVDLRALVDEVASRLGAAERLVLSFALDAMVPTDRILLGVVVANLVENALKYSPAGSSIALSTERVAEDGRDGIVIAVENAADRAGLPDAARVFDKFYRSPGARSRSGSGLGLYIVNGIVQLLEGKVRYQPDGNRVRFRVWLPC